MVSTEQLLAAPIMLPQATRGCETTDQGFNSRTWKWNLVDGPAPSFPGASFMELCGIRLPLKFSPIASIFRCRLPYPSLIGRSHPRLVEQGEKRRKRLPSKEGEEDPGKG